MSDLFQLGEFTAHSGAQLSWKIECDALTEDDLWTLAEVGHDLIGDWGKVIGVPTGGLRFAAACDGWARGGPPLIVDDVLTTGTSMNEYRQLVPEAKGLVIFARGQCPDWVTPIFTLTAAQRSEPT